MTSAPRPCSVCGVKTAAVKCRDCNGSKPYRIDESEVELTGGHWVSSRGVRYWEYD